MKLSDHNQVYIFDEGDYLIEQQAVFFEWMAPKLRYEMRGLAVAYNAERVYLMSATFDDY